jgi:uncharacterized protein YcgI (DUF1989 family)
MMQDADARSPGRSVHVPGHVIFDTILPPRGHVALEIERGQVMRVVDLEGRQVGDLVVFNRADLAEKFWISNTIRLNGTVFVTTGHVLYSELDASGAWTIATPVSKAGDYIDLRAEMDCVMALSNCPQDLNPCNDGHLKPLQLIVYQT